jgi:hypothetical protein
LFFIVFQELERAQKYAFKAQNTISDLKTIVDDARKERQQLFEEISRLQSEGHLQTITGIIKRYMDKGIHSFEWTTCHNRFNKLNLTGFMI